MSRFKVYYTNGITQIVKGMGKVVEAIVYYGAIGYEEIYY